MSRDSVEQAAPVELVDDDVALVLARAGRFLSVMENQAKHISLTQKRGLVEGVPGFRIQHDHAEIGLLQQLVSLLRSLGRRHLMASRGEHGRKHVLHSRVVADQQEICVVRFSNLLGRLIGLAEIVPRIDELDRGTPQVDCSDDRRRLAR